MDNTEQPMYKFNQKRIMKDMLAQLKVYNSKMKMNGSTVSCYIFDIADTKTLLQEFIDKDEEEIIDLDNDDEW